MCSSDTISHFSMEAIGSEDKISPNNLYSFWWVHLMLCFWGSSPFLCFRPSDCILTVCTYVRFQVQTRTEQETDLRSCRLGPCVGAKVVLLSETGDVAWC